MAGPTATSSRRRSVARSRVPATLIRAPAIVELGCDVIRIGYAGDSRPKQVIKRAKPVPPALSDFDTWYRYLGPLLEAVYHSVIQDPGERRAIFLCDFYPPRQFKKALLQYLKDVHVPAASIYSTIECIPMAFPSLDDMLIVHVSGSQVEVLAHVKGQSLAFTYQSVPYEEGAATGEWNDASEYALLSVHNPNSIVSAILSCLQQCPREARPDLVHNLVFSGQSVGKAIIGRVVQYIRRLFTDPSSVEEEKSHGPPDPSMNLSRVPIDVSVLQCLAKDISVLSTSPYSSDVIGWVGASAWAYHWHNVDPESHVFHWEKLDEDH